VSVATAPDAAASPCGVLDVAPSILIGIQLSATIAIRPSAIPPSAPSTADAAPSMAKYARTSAAFHPTAFITPISRRRSATVADNDRLVSSSPASRAAPEATAANRAETCAMPPITIIAEFPEGSYEITQFEELDRVSSR
jgi:hypothetical protein